MTFILAVGLAAIIALLLNIDDTLCAIANALSIKRKR